VPANFNVKSNNICILVHLIISRKVQRGHIFACIKT